MYDIRRRIKDKIKKDNKKGITKNEYYYNDQQRRINWLIKKNKNKLYKEFDRFKESHEIRLLRNDRLIPANVKSMFESSLSRVLHIPIETVTEYIMIVQVYYFQPAEDILKHGFYYNDEKYVFLTASAGQIRLKKFMVIKENVLKQYENTLTCGLSKDIINNKGGVNTNKYLAYLALNNSATEIWKDFNIDKSIVVDDFETMLETEVDYIDDITYEITRKTMEVPIPHMDGCGIMLDEGNRMVRSPWVKGLMVHFKFDELLREWGCNGNVIDIYGKEFNIFQDDIRYIFTKSQFKMWKYYDSWEDYKHKFKTLNCEMSYCNYEENYIPNAKINYQMLQTLSNITNDELKRLADKSINDINNIGSDFRSMNRLLGVNTYNKNKNYIQQALELAPEIIRDNYSKEILKSVKKKLVKNACAGKLAIDGKYTFVIPDIYAFCEWLFLGIESPKGLLKNGEVFCNMFKNNTEIDCLRSPHLFFEHCVRVNTIDNIKSKWYATKGIYTSVFDPISKILQFDCDGDKLLVVQDKTLCRVASKNKGDIVPLYYEMKKAPSEILTSTSLYEGLDKSYRGGKIGLYSNNISKIWNSGEITEEKLKVIKWLCMENNFCIDSAKTLYMPKRPRDIDSIIKQYTNAKVPHFFIYAKDKEIENVSEINDCTVNRLEKIIPNSRLIFNKAIGKFDYKILMSNPDLKWEHKFNDIVKLYDGINKGKYRYYQNKNEKIDDNFDLFCYKDIRNRILNEYNDIELLVDVLVYYLYSKKNSNTKFTLWASFGDVLVENVKINNQLLDNVCPMCGRRFKKIGNQKYCNSCDGSYEKIDKKTIVCIDCGEEFEVDGIVKNKTRCDRCQDKYIRKIKTEKQREYRRCK